MSPAATTQQPDFAELFAGLEITPSEEPLPEISRQRAGLPNPFVDPVKASVEHGTPYSIHVPPNAVSRAVSLINAAARKENYGVRVVVNVQRDEKGAIVKGADGKAQPVVEAKGPNKGTVLVRFQGSAQRKASAPRPFSIVKHPSGNADMRALKDRTSGQIVAEGTHDEMRAELKARKQQAANAANTQD